MTKIIKLEAKGFKSFAQKTELVFKDGFNCIIGPNGSGKSNVVDAVCFVLGKGSAKGLRAEKSANLIYNGGKAKNPAKQGEVSLFFDNTKKTFPHEEDVVKVTRIVKQSGSSVYKINDEVHTRQQLLDFLAKGNVDPDGYNIILQGDIAHFIEMSGVERRQVIEEMAGIGIYEDKKSKALKELGKVEQGINEGNIILTERQVYLKELQKERDQAIKYKQVAEDLGTAKRTLVLAQQEAKQQQLDTIDTKAKKREEDIQKHDNTIAEYKKTVTKHKEDIEAINQEIEEKGETEQVALHKEIETLKITIATDHQQQKHLTAEISRVQERIANLKKDLETSQQKNVESLKEIKDIDQQTKSKTELIEQLGEKIKNLKAKFNLEGAHAIEQRIEQIDQKADELQKEIAQSKEQAQNDLREKDRLEIQLEHIDEKISKIKELETANKKELDSLKQKKVELKKATVELSQELSKSTKITSQLSTARVQFQKASQDQARVEARHAAMLERQGGDIAIKKILENTSKFGNVYGTVASLGVVDQQYSLALEVAAGNKIKGIVVEDEKTAQRCITYLRENKFGVATFYPLNKIRQVRKDPELSKAASARGAIGPAIDLIEYDQKFHNIMSFVFGNTLVVESLDVARRIGIGTTKMVTVHGDTAEKSGAMRGGHVKSNAKGSLFSEKQAQNEKQKTDQKVQDAQIVISSLENDKHENEDVIVRLRELKSHLEGDIIKMEKALFVDAEDVNVNTELKKEFTDKLKELTKVTQTHNNAVMQLTKKLTDLKVERQQLRNEVTDIRNPTKLAELNTFEQRLQETREQIARLSAHKEQLIKQAEQMFAPEIENTERIIKQHHKEIEQFTQQASGLVRQIKEKTTTLAEKEKKQAAFQKQFKQLLEKRNTLHGNVERLEATIIGLEEKIRDLEHQKTSYGIEVARIKAEIAALQEEYTQLGEGDVLQERDVQKLKSSIYNKQQRLDALGNVNLKALDTYERIHEEYIQLTEKKSQLEREKEMILKVMNEIETKKIELFNTIFDILNTNFKRLFQTLSSKGDAYLELENPDSPFEGGAFVKVRLSGTKFMDIRSLSGGEKAMTAMAFIFAILEYAPASFYVMDEVDAPLDKKNASRLAELVQKYCENAQFVVISHNDGVISQADQLYGVSMDEHGTSKVVSLKL